MQMADDQLLSAIFGTDSFARVMAVLADRPGELLAAGEIERLSGVRSRDSLYRSINRGMRSGLLLRRSFGRTGAYEINTASPLYPEMKALLSKTTGTSAQLGRVLSRHPGVKAAFVYGSAASGHDNVASDVDLFVVGEVDELSLVDDLHTIETALGREVNAQIVTSAMLQRRLDSGDPLIADIWRRPRVMLVGDDASLPRPVPDEPNPYFHQEMAVGGAARPYATVVLAAMPAGLDEVSEQALDMVERWVHRVMPAADAVKATPQVGWWQVLPGGETAAGWQIWLYPGPVISVKAVPSLVTRGPHEAAIMLGGLASWWCEMTESLTEVMVELGHDRAQAGLVVNTYGSGDQLRLVDVDFADILPPTRGAAPGQVPAWSYTTRALALPVSVREIAVAAARSLLRHYSFRHLDATIRSLAANFPEVADP
jgi:predicted nucleotidyltransferase